MTDYEKHMTEEAYKDLELALKVPRLASAIMIRDAMVKLKSMLCVA